MPTGQDVQSADDGEAAYLPASQGTHMVLDECEVVPASHVWQIVGEDDPLSVAYLPAMHRLHADAPLDPMYVPGLHDKQKDSDDAPACGEALPM